MIVFCETGLVVTPILPGDSLLFAAGALAAGGSLDLTLLCVLLTVAAIAGDAVNYSIGNFMGPRVLRGDGRFLKKAYLDRTHRFYEKYGGKTIILARFVPIVRTFAPFLAGVGKMTYFALRQLQRDRGAAVDRHLRVRRLLVRQHRAGEEELHAGDSGHHRHFGHAGGRRMVAQPARATRASA